MYDFTNLKTISNFHKVFCDIDAEIEVDLKLDDWQQENPLKQMHFIQMSSY